MQMSLSGPVQIVSPFTVLVIIYLPLSSVSLTIQVLSLFMLMEQRDSRMFTQTLLSLLSLEADSLPNLPSSRNPLSPGLRTLGSGDRCHVCDYMEHSTPCPFPIPPPPDHDTGKKQTFIVFRQ